MSSVSVSPVRSRSDRRVFINFPYELYRGDKHWIAPLRMDTKNLINPRKNAFFEHGQIQPFIARDDAGRVLGRIAAVVNGMHLKKYEDGVGFFGFFETIEDQDVANALIDAAAAWLRENGLKVMRGPTNPSLNDVAGLLVGGFDRPPAILMSYNKPYYESLLKGSGLERIITMWSYYTNSRVINAERLHRGEEIVMKRNPNLTVRALDMSRWYEEINTLLDIYNDAWHDNWGHVPMTDREIKQLADEMKMIVNPDLVNIVEDDGEPVGFSVSLPDINYALSTIPNGRLLPTGVLKLLFSLKLNLIRETRMPLMGVRKSHQSRGIDALIVADVLRRNRDIGMLGCEMSWVLDENHRLRNFLVAIGGVKENEYALFEKGID
jgi:GNAT superfamily N-acetyltransferase